MEKESKDPKTLFEDLINEVKNDEELITGMKEIVKPKMPSDFAVMSVTGRGVKLSWRKTAGAVSYNLYIANDNAPDYTLYRADITDTNAFFEIKDKSELKIRRTYRLCAVDKNGVESQGALCYTVPG